MRSQSTTTVQMYVLVKLLDACITLKLFGATLLKSAVLEFNARINSGFVSSLRIPLPKWRNPL
ncbi:hypothetical protein ACSBR1_022344 [Camellia fascicularis]